MEARLSFVTLGVADLARATAFYRDVLQLPQIAMPILPPSSNETPRPDPFK